MDGRISASPILVEVAGYKFIISGSKFQNLCKEVGLSIWKEKDGQTLRNEEVFSYLLDTTKI